MRHSQPWLASAVNAPQIRQMRQTDCQATLTGWRGGGGGIWRRLAVPADATLEDLALAILQAFKLDNDHLYDFRYRDQRGKRRQYHHSYTDEGPYLHEISVGESEQPLKAEMDFTSTTEITGSLRCGWRKSISAPPGWISPK
jgi:hypothetical protein